MSPRLSRWAVLLGVALFAAGAAEANTLWQRADPQAVAALMQSCAADGSWSERLFRFEYLGLRNAVDKLLPAPAEGGDP